MYIKNWSLVDGRIYGIVYGSQAFDDGDFIKTIPIKSIENNIVTTENNIKYELKDSYTNSLKDIVKMLTKNITLQEYQEFTPKTFIVKKKKALPYLFSGLAAEAGEVAGVYAKFMRDDYSIEELHDKVEKELGDVLYFVSQLANEFNLDLSEILSKNKAKLEDRLARNVLKGNGDDR